MCVIGRVRVIGMNPLAPVVPVDCGERFTGQVTDGCPPKIRLKSKKQIPAIDETDLCVNPDGTNGWDLKVVAYKTEGR